MFVKVKDINNDNFLGINVNKVTAILESYTLDGSACRDIFFDSSLPYLQTKDEMEDLIALFNNPLDYVDDQWHS